MSSSNQSRSARIAVIAMVLIAPLLLAVRPVPARATTFVAPHWVKQIGQPGHATLYPWGMSHETDGTLIVGDYNNYNIKLFGPSGNLVKTFGTKGKNVDQISQPYTVAVDP